MERKITSASFQEYGNLSRLHEDAVTWFAEHGAGFERAVVHDYDPGNVYITVSDAIGCFSYPELHALIEQFMAEHDNSIPAQAVSLPGARPEHLAPGLAPVDKRGERIERPAPSSGQLQSASGSGNLRGPRNS